MKTLDIKHQLNELNVKLLLRDRHLLFLIVVYLHQITSIAVTRIPIRTTNPKEVDTKLRYH
jgi:hypothetical protein